MLIRSGLPWREYVLGGKARLGGNRAAVARIRGSAVAAHRVEPIVDSVADYTRDRYI